MSRPLNPWKLTGYKAGQNVVCKVTKAEPGGYAVLIPKDNLPGFLPTQEVLKPGEEVLAQFVCVHNNRILLSARFGSKAPSGSEPQQKVNWEDELNPPAQSMPAEYERQNYDQAGQAQIDDSQPPQPYISSGSAPIEDVAQSPPQTVFVPDKKPALTEAERAFDVWAPHAQPRKFHLKRATDLILPPVGNDGLKEFKIADYDLEWLITDLEGGMRTGCVKASSDERRSRSGMLLYKGRAVGCIYSSKEMPETLPTEEALHQTLKDLALPQTTVQIYDLPESIILSMSALFLGYPVQRDDNYDARSYMDYICSWFANKGQSACLAISLPAKSATCLSFIHLGQFCGAFYVEDQRFSQDKEFVYELLRADNEAYVEASILPPEMTSSAVRFGFSLSMSRTKRDQ